MIKLYTDIELLNEKNRSYVFPLLFDLHYVKSESLTSLYTISQSPEKADILVLALEFNYAKTYYKSLYTDIRTKAKSLNKPLWVYSGGDFGYTLKDNQVYNFRLGGFKSKLHNRTFIMPSFIIDPYQVSIEKEFKVIPKEETPRIGFVGHTNKGLLKWLSECKSYVSINFRRLLKTLYADYQSFYPSSTKRFKYLSLLKTSEVLKTDFIFRKKYRANTSSKENRKLTTNEFYSNLYTNPYTLCIRGAGNFSVRFYETLAVGRIPILIDTDCLLPLENIIDWKDHCLFIEEKNVRCLEEEILNFHANLTETEFEDLQKKNRVLWQAKLTRHGYFKVLHDMFLKIELIYNV